MFSLSSFSKIKKDGLWLENLDLYIWYLASKTSRLVTKYLQHKHESAYAEDKVVTCLFVFRLSGCVILPVQRTDQQSNQRRFMSNHTVPLKSFKKWCVLNRIECTVSYRIVSYREISVSLQPYVWGAVCKAAQAENNSNILSHLASTMFEIFFLHIYNNICQLRDF